MTVTRTQRSIWAPLVALLVVIAASVSSLPAPLAARSGQAAKASLPERLSDADFWQLATSISEPGGYFRITDNYTSNEREIGYLFTMLRDQNVKGGVYLGVGPEQNFTYIAAIKPAMAFILDIRRQAVMQHLMFKAMFELAKDRADFISILFGKPRPAGLDSNASIQRIWDAFSPVSSDLTLSNKNYTRVMDLLTKTKKIKLTAEEIAQFDSVYGAFYTYGPSISTRGGGAGGGRGMGGGGVTFVDLTGWSSDSTGQPQSFLSTDENFRTVKTLHEKNLIVPVSGDFGGPQALRAIGTYLKKQGGTVSAFYVSNVEQYLFQDLKQTAFYENVAALPLSETSVFIRPYSMRRSGAAQSLCPVTGFLAAFNGGRVYSNNDVLACPK